jgi:hypothetical protein
MFNIIPTADDDDNQGGAPAAPRQVEQLAGGTLRVSTTPPPPAPAQSQQAQEMGTFRTVAGGNVEHSGYSSTTISSQPLAGSIVATARTAVGPASHCTDACTVELPGGMRTDAKTAATLGYLVRNPDGSYSDVQSTAAQAQQGQQQEQPQADPDAAVIPDEEAIAFNQAAESIPQQIVDSATARVIAAVVSGDPAAWEGAAVELARGAGNGLEPAQAAAVVQQGCDTMERAVARAVAPQIGGTSVEARQAFYDWIRQSVDPRELEQCTTRLVYEKSVAGFKSLAARYQLSRGQA